MNVGSLHALSRIVVLIQTIVAYFSTLCMIHVNLSEAAKDLVPQREASGQLYYRLDYEVIVFFGPTELRAELGWKTRVSCGSLRNVVC